MKTIIAKFGRKNKEVVFNQDADGKWSDPTWFDILGYTPEVDVIETCKGADNWKEIRAEHFPMEGFSS